MNLTALWIVLWGLTGAVVGSFLNVVIDRLPKRESVLWPPSHCPSCGRRLAAEELVPLVSFLALKGRCRTCGAVVPRRVFWVELSSAMMFAFLAWRFGFVTPLLIYTVYGCILLVVMVIDLEHQLILNVVILPAIVLALLFIPLRRYLGDAPYAHIGIMSQIVPTAWRLTQGQLAAISQLLGGLVAFAIFWIIWLISPQGMGDGDVRLALFAGLITGFPGALVAVFGSFILGGVVSIGLLATGRVGRKTAIPFAPFLVVTTAIMLLYGDALMRWYL